MLSERKMTLKYFVSVFVFSFKLPTRARFTRGLYFIFVFKLYVGISLKFGDILLMLCGLFSREDYFPERVNLARIR